MLDGLDVTSAPGQTIVDDVQVVANDVGVAFNDLTDSDWASVTLPVWVVDLSTDAPTSGGVDPQQTYDYLNMLSRELQIRGRMIVTLPDFEIAAVNTPGVGRAYAITDSARNVTVTLTDPEGEPVQQTVKDALMATYEAAVLVNVTFVLADATYTDVDVDYDAVRLPCASTQTSLSSRSTRRSARCRRLDLGSSRLAGWFRPSNLVSDNTWRQPRGSRRST